MCYTDDVNPRLELIFFRTITSNKEIMYNMMLELQLMMSISCVIYNYTPFY